MLNGDEFIDQDAIRARLKPHGYRLALLIRDGALPKPRLINGRTGWLWSEIQQSSFMREHEAVGAAGQCLGAGNKSEQPKDISEKTRL